MPSFEFTSEENDRFTSVLGRRGYNLSLYMSVKTDCIEGVQWMLEHGAILKESVMTDAAYYGQLNMLKWLRMKGCPWNDYTSEAAVMYGHLEVLKWLVVEGCPLSLRLIYLANRNGHQHVINWLQETGLFSAS